MEWRHGLPAGPAHRDVGLKKPLRFVNRVVARTLGMRPKPPPKYRILH